MVRKKESFFEQQWVRWSGIIIAISGLIGVGYACGSYKADLDCKVEQIKIIQEYNEKLKSEEYLCKTATIVGLKNEIGELKEATNILQKAKK